MFSVRTVSYKRLTPGAGSLLELAIEVYRLKGPGLLEPIYHKCARRECELRNIPTRYKLSVPIEYKGFVF
jgi:PD-(D/E)XK nuclease superfamily